METAIPVSRVIVTFNITISNVWEIRFLCISTRTCYCHLFHKCVMVSDCVLYLHYHDDGQRYGEHFCVLIYHLLIYIFFGEMSLNIFSTCSNWTVCFLMLSLRVFYTFWIWVLCQICGLGMFYSLLFHLFTWWLWLIVLWYICDS